MPSKTLEDAIMKTVFDAANSESSSTQLRTALRNYRRLRDQGVNLPSPPPVPGNEPEAYREFEFYADADCLDDLMQPLSQARPDWRCGLVEGEYHDRFSAWFNNDTTHLKIYGSGDRYLAEITTTDKPRIEEILKDVYSTLEKALPGFERDQ